MSVEHVERDVARLRAAAHVVTGQLLAGERVELTADRVDLCRDRPGGRAAFRALEEHVLGEVRDPLRLGRLVPRAGREHDETGHGSDLREGRGDDPHTVPERRLLEDRHVARWYRQRFVPGQLTRQAIAAQPEWLAQVPERVGDRRLPEGARVLFTGCGTSFHAALACGNAAPGARDRARARARGRCARRDLARGRDAPHAGGDQRRSQGRRGSSPAPPTARSRSLSITWSWPRRRSRRATATR